VVHGDRERASEIAGAVEARSLAAVIARDATTARRLIRTRQPDVALVPADHPTIDDETSPSSGISTSASRPCARS